ncbi:MAG TPA: tRNA 2-selenouridine(34) synthase MnmH, partial [Bacteroidales bacterium]|nr:tRNA 2-selenouridine(34) synthase MnmH [Bacteroidales bacterium]
LLGLEIAGPRFARFVKKINGLTHKKVEGVIVHCWRGGMRSQAMGWLLEFAGYTVKVLEGGYKAYRSFIRQHITDGPEFIVVGGMTGSGKTPLLHTLKSMGEQVIDLEALASNRGSVFGYLGQHEQPNNEQFENDLYESIRMLNTNLRVWVEDESRSIGTVALPDPFFKKVKSSPLIFIEVPIQERIRRILAEYGMFDAALLTDAVTRLRQQLGAAKVEQIIGHINQGNFEPAVSELLKYYDQNYIKAFRKFNTRKVDYLIIDDDDMIAHARQMILLSQKNNHGTDLS